MNAGRMLVMMTEAEERFVSGVWNPASWQGHIELVEQSRDIPIECLVWAACGGTDSSELDCDDDEVPTSGDEEELAAVAEKQLAGRCVIQCSLYVASLLDSDLTSEFHIVLPVDGARLLGQLERGEALEGLAYGYRRIWELVGDELVPEEGWGYYDLSASEWNQEELCGGAYERLMTLEEVLND